MFLWTLFIAVIFSGSASGVEVKVTVGDEAVFRPEKSLPSPINSIAWKCISSGIVVIAIEWDEDGFNTPNDRFKGLTSLNEKTGVMKIKPVNFTHSGEYTFEVNSKDQGEKFTLTVANRVPKPVIIIEPTDNPDVVYLRCEYSETIIWRNSTGDTLNGSKLSPIGESITVKKNGDPESFYTCSLRNDVSEETSDPIYEKDLFKDPADGGPWWISLIIIPFIAAVGGVLGYKFRNEICTQVRRLPCFKGQGGNGTNTNDNQPAPKNENGNAKAQGDQEFKMDKTDDAKAQNDTSTETKPIEQGDDEAKLIDETAGQKDTSTDMPQETETTSLLGGKEGEEKEKKDDEQ